MAFSALLLDPFSLLCQDERLGPLHEEPGDEEDWPEQRPLVLNDELSAPFSSLRGQRCPLPRPRTWPEEHKFSTMTCRRCSPRSGGRRCPSRRPEEHKRTGTAARREEAVGWTIHAAARLGFSALTAALSVAYLDRCFVEAGRPWKARLAAVACIRLAAKVEETNVPALLPDLQLGVAVGDEGAADPFVFDGEMVRRMGAARAVRAAVANAPRHAILLPRRPPAPMRERPARLHGRCLGSCCPSLDWCCISATGQDVIGPFFF